MKYHFLVLTFFLLTAPNAWGAGEVLKLNTTGTQFVPGFDRKISIRDTIWICGFGWTAIYRHRFSMTPTLRH